MLKTKKIIREQLSRIYDPQETESLVMLILEHVTGYSRLQIHLRQHEDLSESKIVQIGEIMNRLSTGEPIQYILGSCDFYGLKFVVSPAVLIPRPETAELVDWILQEEKTGCRSLLDLGTGSGCIPISIDMHSEIPLIEGWDISDEALEIAGMNGKLCGSRVLFSRQDILQTTNIPASRTWDVIVSNPPYVLVEESAGMAKNVLAYEPHLAIFVPNQDPLLFYRAIARFAAIHLTPGGHLYLEINEKQCEPTLDLLRESGFGELLSRKDLQGKERMIRGRK